MRGDIGARDIIIASIVVLIFGLTVYTTAVMTMNIAKRNQDAVIKNAVSAAIENAVKPSLSCVESRLIENVKAMAENGIHLKGYKVKIEIGNIPESDPWK